MSTPETLDRLSRLPIWAARGAPDSVTDSEGKPVQRRAPINPRSGGLAMNNKPATWAKRATAQKRADTFPSDREPGVGIMLGPDHAPEGLTRAGVDLDGCRDVASGALAAWAERVVQQFGTYAEVSPSRTGLHLLFHARLADLGKRPV